jgi:hypothetical protein
MNRHILLLLLLLMSSETNRANKCEECDKYFSSEEELTQHMNLEHIGRA